MTCSLLSLYICICVYGMYYSQRQSGANDSAVGSAPSRVACLDNGTRTSEVCILRSMDQLQCDVGDVIGIETDN